MTRNPVHISSTSSIKWKAILSVLLVAPAPSIGAWWSFWHDPGPVGQVMYGVGKAWLYGLPLVLWWIWFKRESRPARRLTRDTWRLAIGLGIATAGSIWLAWSPLSDNVDLAPFRQLAHTNHLTTWWMYLGVAAYLSIVNSLLEEYSFRWFLYGRLRLVLPVIPAAILGAIIFAAHHAVILTAQFDSPIAWLATAGVFLGGLMWTWCYERAGSILPGWVSHVIVDAAIMWLGWRMLQAG